MNVYSAVLPGMQRDAVEKLAAIIGGKWANSGRGAGEEDARTA